MSTLTISTLDDDLHQKLAARAQANRRTIEAEAICCLKETIEVDENALDAIPASSWAEIEQSVCETIHDKGTPLTEADFQRYREKARGSTR